MRFVDPVGFEPVQTIVMAGHGDEFLAAAADAFGDGGGADPGGGSVHDAGEFIDDGEIGHLGEGAGEVDAELFAIAEGVHGTQPGRRGAEADGAEQFGDVADSEAGGEAVEDAFVLGPGPFRYDFFAEGVAGEGRLSAAGGADDDADVPVVGQSEMVMPGLPGARGGRDVEDAFELPDARGCADGDALGDGAVYFHR